MAGDGMSNYPNTIKYEGLLCPFEEIRKKIRKHKEYYAVDIFPDYSLAKGDKPSIDQVSGKMGRHMCDIILEYVNEVESTFKDYEIQD